MRLYSIVIASFPKYRTSFLGDQRLPKLSKYTTRLFLFAYATQWVPGPVALSRFTIPLSFRCAPLVDNMLHMKTLKYSTRIRLRVRSIAHWLCQTVFLLSFRHFFFFAVTPCPCLYEPRYSPCSYLYRTRYRDPAPSRDRDVAASSWRRAALLSFTAFATLAAPPIKNPSAPNIGRNGNAPPRFVVGSIRFFVTFFLVIFFFGFMPMPILILAFIAAQTAAALSLRAESLATTHLSALSASTLSAACLSVWSLLREYAMSCSRHAADLFPSSPLASRFVSRVPRQNPEYVTQKEARLSLDSADRCTTLTFITVLYLRCRAVDVRPLRL